MGRILIMEYYYLRKYLRTNFINKSSVNSICELIYLFL